MTSRRTVLGVLGATAASTGTGTIISADEGDELADDEPADDEQAYRASVERALTSQRLVLSSSRYCSADQSQVAAIDREAGDQVRLRRSDDEYAVFTLTELRDEADESVVRTGLQGRRRLGTSTTFEATVDATVPHPELSADEARSQHEFVEHLEDPGEDAVVVISPHGGAITPGTDDQADAFAETTTADATQWGCKGWGGEDGAFERWYVSPYDISSASFPQLAEIVDRGFDYCVSFRGLDADSVHITSTADDAFTDDVEAAVEDATDGEYEIVRRHVPPEERPDDGEGGAAEAGDRLVERLTAQDGTGLWIGQNQEVRAEYGDEIAESVASSLDEHR